MRLLAGLAAEALGVTGLWPVWEQSPVEGCKEPWI